MKTMIEAKYISEMLDAFNDLATQTYNECDLWYDFKTDEIKGVYNGKDVCINVNADSLSACFRDTIRGLAAL